MASDKNDDNGNANFLKEWEVARNILKDFDAHLHDLRKYGFSFLTALLAAESLLIPTWLPPSNSTVLPEHIKVAVLLVDLILIVALQLIDRNYQILQTAAATRAMALERILNLELTEVISQRYTTTHVQDYVAGVYATFTLGVSVLGAAVLYPNYIYIVFLGLVAIIAQILAVIFVRLYYPYGKIDWTLDRLQCNLGDEVAITLTNLSGETIEFKRSRIMWKVVKEDDGKVVKTKKADELCEIKAEDSYTWLWETDKDLDKGVILEPGIYRVHRAILEERDRPPAESLLAIFKGRDRPKLKKLSRKLRIKAKPPKH